MIRSNVRSKMQVAWSIVTDFACAGFPIVILRKLQISQRTKLALWGIMGLGILYVASVLRRPRTGTLTRMTSSSVCCIVKIVYLGQLAKGDFTCARLLTECESVPFADESR